MYKDMTKEKYVVIIVSIIILILLSFAAGMIYNFFIKPSYGLQYANIFFMISFTLIFIFLVSFYHIWITKIQKREENA
jgi:membrane protease YdiL (CAAX protease family)